MSERFYVVGGEYADMSFTTPAAGATLEVHGPFNAREAKVCWRDLTGKTVDNAMVRYFLRSEEEVDGKKYWVVGGEYADSSFTKIRSGKELEVYGPFDEWDSALGFWRGITAKSVDDAMIRYDIRENYQSGEAATGGKLTAHKVSRAGVRAIDIAVPPERVFGFLKDGANWTHWAAGAVKSAKPAGDGTWEVETLMGKAKLKITADTDSGVLDHALSGRNVNVTVPGRIVAGGVGCIFMMAFTRAPSVSEADFARDLVQVETDLTALKACLENGA